MPVNLLFCFILVCHCLADHNDFQRTLGHLKASASSQIQAQAALQVITRTIGQQRANEFLVSIDPTLGPSGKDTFKIRNTGDKIEITATTAGTAAWGFHYLIKNYFNCHISWDGNQVNLPNVQLGTIPVNISVTSNDRFRYYQNVCTAGYSSTWWGWQQWEKNLDWMALNGINLALAFHGQEAIWQKVYLELNLTQDEIDQHFAGPAFLPWSRMGNIRGWGGPLSPSWHSHTISLQHKILQRMNDLGIIAVLPAFAGHVPRAISRIFPEANVTKIGSWNKFADKYCCPFLLSPEDSLFRLIGSKFLQAYIDTFGTSHIYNCDTFNENDPANGDPDSLRSIGRAVYSTMTDVDPDAVWLMQGWLFVHDFEYWTESRVEAFVTSVPIGKMIVLDLQSEQFPQYERLKSYYGQPFIWCMLHNFGGTLGMFGSAGIINQRVIEGRKMNASTMIGTGLTPEGINQNYVIYELMNEMAYRQASINLDAWFENYALRRYGEPNEFAGEAWRSLGSTLYDFIGIERIRGHYVITRRPSLKIKPWTWYDRETVLTAWDTFIEARYSIGNKSPLYRHDLVDLTRQALQLTAENIYENIRQAFGKSDLSNLRLYSVLLLELFDDLETILAASDDFLLGKWLEDAKSLAVTDVERKSFEYNARNQITLWGPNGEIRDYANKQWSGVVADYFKPRWSLFLRALDDCVSIGKKFNISEINELIFYQVEQAFTVSNKSYPVQSQGDAVKIAVALNKKWRKRNITVINI